MSWTPGSCGWTNRRYLLLPDRWESRKFIASQAEKHGLSCHQHGSRRGAALLGSRTMPGFASRLALGVAIAAAFAAAVRTQDGTSAATDWPSVNYDQSANRYSPLDQITAGNVS